MFFNNINREIRLNDLFRYEENKNTYIIDISIENYNSLYSKLDFSPFKNKDLDDGLILYLEDSIEDIPFKYNILIDIHMSKNLANNEKEIRSKREIKHYFEYLKRKKIKKY